MEKNTVSIQFVHSAIASIKDYDIDYNNILFDCGIDASLLDVQDARVTAAQFSSLWLAVARHLNDEFFGQDAHRMKVGSFAMLCRTLIHCKTLKDALLHMLEFFNLLLDDYHCELIMAGQYSQIRITEQPTTQFPRVFGHETLLIFQHGLACWLVGRRIPVVVAGFAYPEPRYSKEYQLMYAHDLQFDQPYTSLTFDRGYLDLPLVQNERTAREFIKEAPANIVLKYKNHSGYAATIRKVLRAMPIADWPDFDAFAIRLNMTRSTLRRRLEEEGQSFQAIKDQLRRDLAMTALNESDKSIVDIATELGFAEPSAFHRAFKKWTQVTPSHYRQQIRQTTG